MKRVARKHSDVVRSVSRHFASGISMSPVRSSDIIWSAWLLGTAGSFAYLERRALKQNTKGVTLTAFTKRWLGIHPRKPWSLGSGAVFLVGLAWIALHILVDLVRAAEEAMEPDE